MEREKDEGKIICEYPDALKRLHLLFTGSFQVGICWGFSSAKSFRINGNMLFGVLDLKWVVESVKALC